MNVQEGKGLKSKPELFFVPGGFTGTILAKL